MKQLISIRNAIILLLAFNLVACYQSDPKPASFNTSEFGRVGDSIRFSGYDWTVKVYENSTQGPGPNYFSGNERDIYIDENGYLHMKIVKRGEKWMSTEVVADEFTGYGTYRFTIEGNMDALVENVVLGLFTWDNNSFQEQANSEVDIEFSRWGEKSVPRTLQYGVQPINFGPYFPERSYKPVYPEGTVDGVSTHEFTWEKDKITWRSYSGDSSDPENKFGEWTFDSTNPARVKNEGGRSSNPIVIPAPGSTTSARINFWILTGINPAPADGQELEVIVRKFEYIPE